ncbi:16S rRNA methyltransferase [Brevundimonas sp. Leaf363]|uniref:16S rRNA (uracil(1498)-N(3))-methyltransferase n=1 Tax=Brevundimonas sp. Leaf363 TaxID=1736353 RepID=UPI0006F42409|nr:16S rRNA (uracil(1498)-N(3))-methyltransferase [Brevundimonas sp. Leaf363]KQS53939.1 16S rRNA methyltransferase [Brevundimonas sp. Leaf363]
MIRLHIAQPLSAGAALAPTLDQSRYLTQVMRLKAGDALAVFNGVDGEWRCSVAEVLKKGVVLKAEERLRGQVSPPDIELLLAVVKKSALEFAVEKATELGAARIRLVQTARTQPQHLRLDRLDAIAEESAEQTGRMDVPPVDDPVKLDALLDGWDPARRLMFCDETGGPPALVALRASPSPGREGQAPQASSDGAQTGSVAAPTPSPLRDDAPPRDGEGEAPWAILIGPEGGFTPEEGERLRALPYATAVSLGPRVLRADTAATVALTLWQAALGDWER